MTPLNAAGVEAALEAYASYLPPRIREQAKGADQLRSALTAAIQAYEASRGGGVDSEALFDWLQAHHKSVGVTPKLRAMYAEYLAATNATGGAE